MPSLPVNVPHIENMKLCCLLVLLSLAPSLGALHTSHKLGNLWSPRFLRFHVADIPPKYSWLRVFDDPNRLPLFPLDYLGPVDHPESVVHSTHNTDYNIGVRTVSQTRHRIPVVPRTAHFIMRLPRAPCAWTTHRSQTLSTCRCFG